jgi:hypothetical protein
MQTIAVTPYHSAVAASGTAQATITWDGGPSGDPVPPCVIVVESSSASFDLDFYAITSSGTCADGLGHTATYVYGQSNIIGGSSSGTRTTLHQNASSFTVSCSPAINYGFTPDPPGYTEPLNAYISYSVAVYVPTLTLGGTTTVSSSPHILTGQQLTATASSGGYPGGFTYDWAMTGAGKPFIAYSPAQSSCSAPVAWSDLTATSASSETAYFSDLGTATVTCTMHTAGLSAIVLPMSITVDKPTITPAVVTFGQMRLNSTPDFQFMDSSLSNGFVYNVALHTPSGFTSAAGHEAFVQLVDPEDIITLADNSSVYLDARAIVGSRNPDQTVLDSNFPLLSIAPDQTNTLMDTPGIGNAGTTYTDPVTSIVSNVKSYLGDKSFATYSFYLPPGTNSKWVALYKQAWHAVGTAVVGSPYVVTDSSSQGASGAITALSQFPFWSGYIN